MSGRLRVEGTLEMTLGPRARLTLRGRGDSVELDFADLASVRAFGSWLHGSPERPASGARRSSRPSAFRENLRRGLESLPLRVDVAIAGQSIARLGTNARAGWLVRQLDLGPLELRLGTLLRVLARGRDAGS